MIQKLHDKFLFNFLAQDAENAANVMEAGHGYVVPGITSDNFNSAEGAVKKIKELKSVSNIVSVGLGGSGNVDNWKKVLDIAAASEPGHLNQPFETAAYSLGYLDGKDRQKQLVNALVKPAGEVGKIQLANSGNRIKVEEFISIASNLGIESIKMMPVNGTEHLDELIYLTKVAQANGIRGIEPAGGINASNIKDILAGVKDIEVEFFMPHIFGSTIDKQTGETIPGKVMELYEQVEGL